MSRGREGGARWLLLALLALLYAAFVYRYGVALASAPMLDWPSYYSASQLAFQEGESPYGVALLSRNLLPFLPPPTGLLPLQPFGLVSYPTSQILLLVVSHLCLLASAWLMLESLRPRVRRPLHRFLLLAYLLVAYPTAVTLSQGQLNLMILLFLAAFGYSVQRRLPAPITGGALALATLYKLYPGFLLLFLAIKGRFREAAWCLGGLGFAVLLSLVVLPDGLWREWFVRVLPTGGYGRVPYYLFSPAAPWNQSLNGFVARIFLENEFTTVIWPNAVAARLVPYGLCLAVVLPTLAVSRRVTQRRGDRFLDLEFGLFLLATFLIAPISWEHHLVMVFPAILACGHHLLLAQGSPRLRLAVFVLVGLMALPLPFRAESLRAGPATLLISMLLYAVVALWLILLAWLWRASRPDPSPGQGPGGPAPRARNE